MADLELLGGSPMEVDRPPGLPFPGPSYAENNQDDVQYIELASKKKSELVDLCKRFHLPHSGNKQPLIDRLRAFSERREGWTCLLPHVTKMHLGPTQGRVAKSKKQSTKRWEQLQEADASTSSANVSMGLAELGAHQDKHEATLAWAARVVKALPYRPREERLMRTQPAAPPLVPAFVPPAALAPPPMQPPLPVSVGAPAVASSSGSSAPAAKPPVQRKLTLAGGRTLMFTADDVPPVPAATFAANIAGLAAMWDDRWPEWGNNSYIRIRGVPIALVYWRDLYTARQNGGEAGHWHSLKGRWSDWKLIAERWHQGTPQQFWSAFTDTDGKRMDWTAILAAVRRQRVEDNRRVAQEARRVYGVSFAKHFSYKKSGKAHTYQKDTEIAKRYRQLQGLGEQSD